MILRGEKKIVYPRCGALLIGKDFEFRAQGRSKKSGITNPGKLVSVLFVTAGPGGFALLLKQDRG